MSQESAAVEAVLSAHERTLRRGSARIAFRLQISADDYDFFPSESRSIRHRDGSVLRRSRPVFDRMLVWCMRRLIRRVSKATEVPMPGVVDFQAHRCVYHGNSSMATLIVGNRRWYAAPGTAVDELSAGAASVTQPLWLVDLVGGVVDATEQAPEDVNGRTTRRFSAHADLNRAVEAVSYEMEAPPEVEHSGDLTRIPVEVCVDHDGYIRRIRYTTPGPANFQSTSTVDVMEFGVALPSDWSRIPHASSGSPLA
jgi:hypothetical protein